MSEPVWKGDALRSELDRYERELRDAGKTRNTVNTYVQPVERFLNWLTGSRPIRHATPAPPRQLFHTPLSQAGNGGRGSRYDGLRDYLMQRTEPVVHLSFVEVERIIGGPLPASARKHPAWWSNHRPGTNVQAHAWLEVGRRTANTNLNSQTVDFTR